jgi:flavin-dependent dehydrogenase
MLEQVRAVQYTLAVADAARAPFDVAVIGGGPGGSSAATALARRGRSVLVLERDVFPRFHIGESQLPWSDEVFRALGVREKIAAAGFVEKWGASFLARDGGTEQYADFAQAAETPEPRTFQVPRGRFDEILLDHAASSGATVRQGTSVVEVDLQEDGVRVTSVDAEGRRTTDRAAAVVDASGRAGFLARRLGRHDTDPLLRNIAVHGQFEGIPRQDGRRAGDIRMLTRPDMGWMWLIPLSPTTISVGAVVPQEVHNRESKATPEASLRHYIETTPGAAPLFAAARATSPARFDADYSYLATRLTADRVVVVGDAAAFLDPIFSTGVLLAMQAGLEAAAALDGALAAGDLRARRFAAYERRVRARYRHFRRFAVGFYDPAFRDLWFTPSPRFGIYPAVLSVLAGNWRPGLATRLRIALFFALVGLQRRLPIVARRPDALLPVAQG